MIILEEKKMKINSFISLGVLAGCLFSSPAILAAEPDPEIEISPQQKVLLSLAYSVFSITETIIEEQGCEAVRGNYPMNLIAQEGKGSTNIDGLYLQSVAKDNFSGGVIYQIGKDLGSETLFGHSVTNPFGMFVFAKANSELHGYTKYDLEGVTSSQLYLETLKSGVDPQGRKQVTLESRKVLSSRKLPWSVWKEDSFVTHPIGAIPGRISISRQWDEGKCNITFVAPIQSIASFNMGLGTMFIHSTER